MDPRSDPATPHPAIEFGERPDDSTSWFGIAVTTIFFAGLGIAFAVPSLWESWIADNDSRRFGGLLNLVERIGQWPAVGLLALIAAFGVMALAHEVTSARKEP